MLKQTIENIYLMKIKRDYLSNKLLNFDEKIIELLAYYTWKKNWKLIIKREKRRGTARSTHNTATLSSKAKASRVWNHIIEGSRTRDRKNSHSKNHVAQSYSSLLRNYVNYLLARWRSRGGGRGQNRGDQTMHCQNEIVRGDDLCFWLCLDFK